jgi:transposase
VFFDEFGFSFQEPLARTWAPVGQRPILKRVEYDRRGVSTAVGLTLSGQIYKRHFLGSLKSEQVIETLEHLQRHLRRPICIIWDRASIHTSGKTTAYLAAHPHLQVESIPSYAPEINPEELCHGNVKAHLKNATPDDTVQVRKLLDRGFARLRHRPDLLLQFIRHAGLVVKQLW